MKHLVFVFGTLKQGFPNFGANKGVRVPGAFATRQRFPLYLVGGRCSPWMVDLPGQGETVAGQVFEVDQAALEAMDRLERVAEPDGYRRVLLEVEQAGRVVSAFAYLKQARHLDAAEVRAGPLADYTLEHAALYRPRDAQP